MTAPLIDRQVIDRLLGIAERSPDPGFLAGVFALYVEHTPPLLDEMTVAAQRGDRSSAARVAHRLKGSSLSVGAAAMTQGCVDMEHLCGASTFEPAVAGALGERLKETFAATAQALERIASDHRKTPPSAPLQ